MRITSLHQEVLESSLCDPGMLDFPGAALHAANVSVQSAFSNTTFLGTSVLCDLDSVSIWAVEAFDAEGKPVPSRDN
jgi:hypothetical protein